MHVSPLRILAQRGYKALQDDRILPNIHKDNVVRARLRNGEEWLFLPEDVRQFSRERPVDPAADYIARLAGELREDDLNLMVLLVPHAYTVYYPLLQDPPAAPAEGELYLNRLDERLRAAGVAVVNLTPAYRARAPEALAQGQDLYWRDDAHWTPYGIALAAERVAQSWRR